MSRFDSNLNRNMDNKNTSEEVEFIGLELKRIPIKGSQNGDSQIMAILDGEDGEISVMLMKAMAGNDKLASIIMASIPTYLDHKKLDRRSFCEKCIMQGHGLNGPQK